MWAPCLGMSDHRGGEAPAAGKVILRRRPPAKGAGPVPGARWGTTASGFVLGDPEDLLQRGDAVAGLVPAVLPERHHAARRGVAAQLARRGLLHDQAPRL